MANNARTPTRPRRLVARERDRQALELRIQGLTFAAIGANLGVTWQAAQQAVKRSLNATKAAIAENADELRAIEAERLEKITEILWPRVLEGDLRAIDRVLRARESFRRLTGLDVTPDPAEWQDPVTYVLTSGDVSLIPPGASSWDTRLPSERPEPRRLGTGARAEFQSGGDVGPQGAPR